MNLTEMQSDVLKEIMNIGVSKSATQLSVLLNDEIRIEVPDVNILSLSEVSSALFLNSALCASKRDITGTLAIVITSDMVDSVINKLSRYYDFTGIAPHE